MALKIIEAVVFLKTKIPSDAVLFPPKIPCYKPLSIVEYGKETKPLSIVEYGKETPDTKKGEEIGKRREKKGVRFRVFNVCRCRYVSHTLDLLF